MGLHMQISSALKRQVKDHAAGWLISVCGAVVVALFTWGFPDAWERGPSIILSRIEPKGLLAVLVMSVLLNVVLFTFLVPLLMVEKLFPKFGIYWDKKGNSYCPKCKSLTSQVDWATHEGGQWRGLRCSCSPNVFVLTEKDSAIGYPEAVCRMQK